MSEPGPWHDVERWIELLRDKREDEEFAFWNGVDGEEPTHVQFIPRKDREGRIYARDVSAFMPSNWSQPAKYVRLVPVSGGLGGDPSPEQR
jgi:hypothetical protein